MMQKEYFMQGEGDAWLNRNRDILGKHDPVSEMIEQQGIRPERILEVGCADGWRLAKLREKYGAVVFGVEPSMEACIEAAERRVPVHQMTASCLPVVSGGFDLIIYGFVLYLADPKDWFTIVAEGDRALADGGYLVIHDFAEHLVAFAKHYEHRAGVLSYHVPFSQFWRVNPLYELIASRHDPDEQITILRKKPARSIKVES